MLVLRNFSELFRWSKISTWLFPTTRLAGNGANPPKARVSDRSRGIVSRCGDGGGAFARVFRRASSTARWGLLGAASSQRSFIGAIRRANSGNVARGAAQRRAWRVFEDYFACFPAARVHGDMERRLVGLS